MASSILAMRTLARSKGMPACSYSGFSQPAPNPSSRRPSESTSSVAASLASRTGWRKSLSNTRLPTRNVLVASAAATSAGIGESWSPRWSGSNNVEYPNVSAWRAMSLHSVLDLLPWAETPKRNGRGLLIRDSFALFSPSAHWLEHDRFFKVVQRLNRILDRKLLPIDTLPVSSIQCSNHQILVANDCRVENAENSRNNLI